jgi:hypothetical protein
LSVSGASQVSQRSLALITFAALLFATTADAQSFEGVVSRQAGCSRLEGRTSDGLIQPEPARRRWWPYAIENRAAAPE